MLRIDRFQMNPQMPAHKSLARQSVYRQGRGVHEALVGARDSEGREVVLDAPILASEA